MFKGSKSSSAHTHTHLHLHYDAVAQRKKGSPISNMHRPHAQFGQWAIRTGFYLLAAAAFVSSLSLLVLRYRTLEAEEAAWGAWRAAEGRDETIRLSNALGASSVADHGHDSDAIAKGENFKLWADQLLNTSVPIIMSKRTLRSKEVFSCGGSHVVKFRSYKDLRAIPHLADVLPERDLLTTPGKPLHKKYKTCAVVGNSGSLLETQYGDAVDSHEVVIRFNAAKTEGYEQFVGYKTTFRILNSAELKIARDSGEAGITTLRNNDMKDWVKGIQSSPAGGPVALTTDPEFLCHTWAWVRNRGDKPSSGLVGIVMALRMCQKVDIYGFQYSNYFSRYSRPHYYDWERPKKGREKVHPFNREVSLYAQLARQGYLKVW